MKTSLLFLLLLTVTFSCKKENPEQLLANHQPVYGIWKPLTMSYDSMEVNVTAPIPYNRLVINNNLTYKIYGDTTQTSIEDGTVTIISQTNDQLEVYFAAKYPLYSSFAGSHIFGFTNVVIDSLTNNTLVFKSTGNFYYPNTTFLFKKL